MSNVLARVEALIRELDLSRFPIRMELGIEEHGIAHVRILVHLLDVPAREDDGSELRVTMRRVEPRLSLECASDYKLLQMLRWHVQQAILHELDEHLLFAGVRPFDPHAAGEGLRVTDVPGASPMIYGPSVFDDAEAP